MVWEFILKKFITLKTFGIAVLLSAGFYLGQSCQNKKKQREINRMESKLSDILKESRNLHLKDSTSLSEKDTIIKRLQISVQLKDNLIGQYQVSEQANKRNTTALKQELQTSKELVKKAISAGTIICDTLILERKQKLLSNKYYYKVIEKPENLKELIRD